MRSVGPEGWVELGDGAQAVWRVEAAPPDTTLTSLPSPRSRSADFTWTADEAATFECRWDEGTWHGCYSDLGGAVLTDGPHSFEVRATDDAGRRETLPARHEWTIDAKVPETTIVEGPRGVWGEPTAVYVFTADEPGVTFECQSLNGWFPCRSGERLPLIGTTGWFRVRARDAVGNVDASPAEWKVDHRPDPPQVYLRRYDGGGWPFDAAYIGVSYERGDTAECRVDGGPWVRCGERIMFYDLPVGQRVIEARATDDFGRVGPVFALTVEVIRPFSDLALVPAERAAATADPDTTITSGPPSRQLTAAATFTFASDDPGARFECRFNYDPIPCPGSTLTVSSREGENDLHVTAVAADGTRDATPAHWEWHVNAEPPETWISSLPATRAERARFGWANWNDEVVRSECRLDGGEWFACTSPLELTVAAGPHRFELRNIDVDGRVDPTPAAHEWVADPITPAVTIVSGPRRPPPTSPRSPSRSTARERAAECRLDYGAWAPCASPVRYTGLTEADHRVQVRALNQGRVSEVVQWGWRVDRDAAGHAHRRHAVRERLAHVALEHDAARSRTATRAGRGLRSSLGQLLAWGRAAGSTAGRARTVRRQDVQRPGRRRARGRGLRGRRRGQRGPDAGAVRVDGRRAGTGHRDRFRSRHRVGARGGVRACAASASSTGSSAGSTAARGRVRGVHDVARRARRGAPLRGAGAQRRPLRRVAGGLGVDGRRAAVGGDRVRPATRSARPRRPRSPCSDDVFARVECRVDGGAWGGCVGRPARRRSAPRRGAGGRRRRPVVGRRAVGVDGRHRRAGHVRRRRPGAAVALHRRQARAAPRTEAATYECRLDGARLGTLPRTRGIRSTARATTSPRSARSTAPARRTRPRRA